MPKVTDVTIPANKDGFVATWRVAAKAAGISCTPTELATTRAGTTIHRDIVSCSGKLYKILLSDGVARAELVTPGTILPESVQIKVKAKPGEREKALGEWLKAAKAASCDVKHVGPARIALNGIGTIVHKPTNRTYEVLFSGTDDYDEDVFAVPR